MGGLRASGRWHTAGKPIAYCAPNPATALLEIMVHQNLSADELPDTYQLLELDVPDGVSMLTADMQAIGEGWATNQDATRAYGDLWLQTSSSALLQVPSVVVPLTLNSLINPRHPDALRIEMQVVGRFPFGPRLRPAK